jgi:hypothetical protein
LPCAWHMAVTSTKLSSGRAMISTPSCVPNGGRRGRFAGPPAGRCRRTGAGRAGSGAGDNATPRGRVRAVGPQVPALCPPAHRVRFVVCR